MRRFDAFLRELDRVPPAIAWKLVDTLFQQRATMVVGAAVFVALGVLCYCGTGSRWYLAGAAASAAVGALRWHEIGVYRRGPQQYSPNGWAWRSLRTAWATTAIWGAWGFAIPYERQTIFPMMMLCVVSGSVIGGAVRNNAVRLIAAGQALLAMSPIFIACLLSGSIYIKVFSLFILTHLVATGALIQFLNRQTLRLLQTDAERSELIDRVASANQELETANEHLQLLVGTDALTGVSSRRAFDLTVAREWRRLAREDLPLSLLLLDVDHFKSFNDHYGHPAGDRCLREVAAAICAVVRRPGDMVARYGGEEFIILLPGTEPEGARQLAEAIVQELAARALVHHDSPYGRVTASIGIASAYPRHAASMEQLTMLADSALYTAKHRGRCQVAVAMAD